MSPIIGVRSSVFCTILAYQSAEHDCLAVPNAHARGDLARAENRLINHVVRETNWGGERYAERSVDPHCIDGTAVVDEAFELDNLWN